MPDICLMVLIGLPGAGKTTFSKWLLQTSLQANVIHICYDNIIAFNKGTEDEFESSEFKYKQQRHHVINGILLKLITTIKTNGCISEIDLPKHVKLNAYTPASSSNYLIICDDNHYYRSMRYELYRLARFHNLSYIQVYLDCNVTTALERNIKRSIENRVPEEIIHKISQKLEKPSLSVSWEKNTIIFNTEKQLQKNIDVNRQIFPLIMEAFKTPLTLPPVNNASSNKDQSMTHKLDLLLRKRITEILKTNLTLTTKDEKCQKVESLQKQRKDILTEFKKVNGVTSVAASKIPSALFDFVQLLN